MGLKMTDLMSPPPDFLPHLKPDTAVQRSFTGSRRLEVPVERTAEEVQAEKDRAERIWKALRSAL